VDYNNTGVPSTYAVFPTNQLISMRFTDPIDTDMSGAVIFATQPGTGWAGPPVDIAAAWGQDPSVSRKLQDLSMDLGTAVLPFTTVRATKVADKDSVVPGEVLTYTIRVSNAGHTPVAANTLLIQDTLDQHVEFIKGSTALIIDGNADNAVAVPDSISGTPFPLDGGGYYIPNELRRRGGTADLQFQVLVNDAFELDGSTSVVNTGNVTQTGATKELPFSVETPIFFPSPSAAPSVSPSSSPSATPSASPSSSPSSSPSAVPNAPPSVSPTSSPTVSPTSLPSVSPTSSPNVFPSSAPSESHVTPTLPPTLAASVLLDVESKSSTKQNCLQDEWTEAGNAGDLDCTSDEVLVEELSSLPNSCVPGTTVAVTVNVKIRVNGSKYDVGWYVAVDNGDALEGTCTAAGFQNANAETTYSVDATTEGDGGVVSFCDFEIENDNKCGDVLLYSNVESASVWVPLLVETEVPCLDENDDGALDLTLCVSWRTEEMDVSCSLDEEIKVGIYPSSTSACHCETYDVPQITVVTVQDVVAPCS